MKFTIAESQVLQNQCPNIYSEFRALQSAIEYYIATDTAYTEDYTVCNRALHKLYRRAKRIAKILLNTETFIKKLQ